MIPGETSWIAMLCCCLGFSLPMLFVICNSVLPLSLNDMRCEKVVEGIHIKHVCRTIRGHTERVRKRERERESTTRIDCTRRLSEYDVSMPLNVRVVSFHN